MSSKKQKKKTDSNGKEMPFLSPGRITMAAPEKHHCGFCHVADSFPIFEPTSGNFDVSE